MKSSANPVTRRYMYRCHDCLAVSAVDGVLVDRRARCDCGGTVECLGYVRDTGRRYLARDSFDVPCDHRCTGATGPNCDCSCRGENHGTGRVVTVVVDVGGVPRLRSPDVDRGHAWRWTLAALDALAHERFPMADYLASRRIHDYGLWRATRAARDAMAHAKRAKTWHGRRAAVAKLVDEWTRSVAVDEAA